MKAQRKIGAVVEMPSIYLDLTATDNMKQQCSIIGLPSFDAVPDLLKLVGLENTGKKKAKKFSLGMRQRLGIAVALIGRPDLLILDELSRLATHYGFIDKGVMVKEITAKELEASCKKRVELVVSDVEKLLLVLDKMGYKYDILSIHDIEESLESYYINLIGGKSE